MKSFCVIVTIIVLVQLNLGSAETTDISCYECQENTANSNKNGCFNPITNNITSSINSVACKFSPHVPHNIKGMKYKCASYKLNYVDRTTITRQCIPNIDGQNAYCDILRNNGKLSNFVVENCNTCDSTNCNSGGIKVPFTILTVTSLLLGVLYNISQ